MDEPPATPPKRRMGIGSVMAALVLTCVAASICVPYFNRTSDKANQMKAASYCMQITMALKSYASDHNGQYPTGATANDAFCKLIQGKYLPAENVIGCPGSRYEPDGNIGPSPSYPNALEPGENHWMMVDGMTMDSPGSQALILENGLDTTWPPKWALSSSGFPFRGRTQRGDKVVIGLNDGSHTVQKIDHATGDLESSFPFFPIPQGHLKLLDIEE